MGNCTAEVLNGTADLLEKDGWCQFHSGDYYEGPRCLDSALAYFASEGFAAYWLAHEALRSRIGILSNWNDVDGRSEGEVLALLRETATFLDALDFLC